MMRIFTVVVLGIVIFFANSARAGQAGRQPGVMEKAGAAIDRGTQEAVEFFDDSAITARIKKRLLRDDYVSVLDIAITTRQGAVIVEGEVENERLAGRVMAIVRATRGVAKAENHLVLVRKEPSKVK